MLTTRIVSCKSNLQLVYDCRVGHEEYCGFLKHVLKPYDNRSGGQFYIVEIVHAFSMTRAARPIKIARDNRKQISYRVDRPLELPDGAQRARELRYVNFTGTKSGVSFLSNRAFQSQHRICKMYRTGFSSTVRLV